MLGGCDEGMANGTGAGASQWGRRERRWQNVSLETRSLIISAVTEEDIQSRVTGRIYALSSA